MKKKISLLLCILITSLSFAGCSGNKAEGIAETDKENAKVLSEYLVTVLAQSEDEEFESLASLSDYELNYELMSLSYTLQQYGYPKLSIDSEAFRGMIKAWQSAEDECGAYVSCGEFKVEEKSGGLVISVDAEFESRDAELTFSFNEDMEIESLDASAEYSLGEILQKAGLNTLLGMGTVFAVLIFLAFLISLMKYIPVMMEKFAKKEKASVQTAPAPVAAAEEVECVDDLELVAVIAAAIAAHTGTSTDGFVVRSIRRRPSNNWN